MLKLFLQLLMGVNYLVVDQLTDGAFVVDLWVTNLLANFKEFSVPSSHVLLLPWQTKDIRMVESKQLQDDTASEDFVLLLRKEYSEEFLQQTLEEVVSTWGMTEAYEISGPRAV